MAYNYWKMMDQVGAAVCSRKPETWRGKEQFDGYIFEAKDENARKSAEDWARRYDNQYDRDKETIVYEPDVYIFENKGFAVTILDSAGGSSQGGRLSFWKCKVEKDGIEFTVGVNDAILADLIRNSDIEKGTVKQKVMFARRGGQPGFIHEGMESYKEAVADMAHKAEMKKAKKTKKWEAGGVYQTVTQTDVCLGEVWDTMEEYEVTSDTGYWGRTRTKTNLRKAETPKKVYAWTYLSNYRHKEGIPETFNEFLKEELGYTVWFSAGIPPARAKTRQLEVTEEDLKLVDKILAAREDSITNHYDSPKVKGRYVRVKP
jgi:hypothetical protein